MNLVFIPTDLDRSISHKISRYDRHLPITVHACWVNNKRGKFKNSVCWKNVHEPHRFRSTLIGLHRKAGYLLISLEGKFTYAFFCVLSSRLKSFAFVEDWL